MRLLAVLVALVLVLAGSPAAAVDPGADYSWYRPTRAQLAGLDVIARYLVPASWGSGKALTADEARWLLTQGKTIVLNFEWSSTGARGGYAAGVRDAHAAELARLEIGAPPVAVYFSADWDVQPAEIPTVLSYLRGVADTIGRSRTGLYGGLRAVSAALNDGYPWAWQTYAWSRGRWDTRAQFRQTANGALFAGLGDRDIAIADVHGWWIGATFPIQGGEQQRPRYVPPPPPAPPAVYTVRRGDTLTLIARRYGTTVARLVALNHIRIPDRIRTGTRLVVTGVPPAPAAASSAGTYRVRRGDTLSGIAARHHTTAARLARLNHLSRPNRIYPGQRIRLR
jgi:LysM repeat protein